MHTQTHAMVRDPSCSGTALSRLNFVLASTQTADAPPTAAALKAAAGTAAQDGADGGDSAAPAVGEGDDAAGDEFPGPTGDTSARTLALMEFQKRILRYALRFPNL